VVLTESGRWRAAAQPACSVGAPSRGMTPPARPAAGIALGANRANYWNTGNTVLSSKFDTAGGTTPVYLYPWMFTEANGVQSNGGEVANFFALQDGDGSLVGSGGGFVVANNPSILPPPPSQNLHLEAQIQRLDVPRHMLSDGPNLVLRTQVHPLPQVHGYQAHNRRAESAGDYSYITVSTPKSSS